MKQRYLVTTFTLLGGLMWACGLQEAHELKESTTEQIAPQGGITRSADALLAMTFPEGAVLENTEITVETDRTRTLAGLRSAVYRILPEGLTFNAPVSLQFSAPAGQADAMTLKVVQGNTTSAIDSCQTNGDAIECTVQNALELALFDVEVEVEVPVEGEVPANEVTEVVDVFAGQFWGCAQLRDQTLSCWGVLDNTSADPDSLYPTDAVSSVSKGHYHHACALDLNDEAVCFGKIDFGQNPPAGTKFTAFSAGAFHNCGILATPLANTNVQCWGHPSRGQLEVPTGMFHSLSAGLTHNCALRDDDTVACWGEMTNGPAAGSEPSGTFKSVKSGGGSCAQRSDNALECWGFDFGSVPAGPFVDYSVGSNHACGLRSNLQVECWGQTQIQEGGQTIDISLSASTEYLAVSAGANLTCGLTRQGQVECLGENSLGQATPPRF